MDCFGFGCFELKLLILYTKLYAANDVIIKNFVTFVQSTDFVTVSKYQSFNNSLHISCHFMLFHYSRRALFFFSFHKWLTRARFCSRFTIKVRYWSANKASDNEHVTVFLLRHRIVSAEVKLRMDFVVFFFQRLIRQWKWQ